MMPLRWALVALAASRALSFALKAPAPPQLSSPTRLPSAFFSESESFSSGPTEKQVAFANRLAGERGVGVPAEAMESSMAMSQFIEECLQQQPNSPGGGGMGGAYTKRAPSDKQVAFAARLAAEKGLAIPEEAMSDSQAMSQFIDSALTSNGVSWPAQPLGGEGVDNGELFHEVDLGRQRSARVRTFAGRVMVDVREFYESRNGGAPLPTKKGLALTVEQWQALRAAVADIDTAVAAAQASVGLGGGAAGGATQSYEAAFPPPPTRAPTEPLPPAAAPQAEAAKAVATAAAQTLQRLIEAPKASEAEAPWEWEPEEEGAGAGGAPSTGVPF